MSGSLLWSQAGRRNDAGSSARRASTHDKPVVGHYDAGVLPGVSVEGIGSHRHPVLVSRASRPGKYDDVRMHGLPRAFVGGEVGGCAAALAEGRRRPWASAKGRWSASRRGVGFGRAALHAPLTTAAAQEGRRSTVKQSATRRSPRSQPSTRPPPLRLPLVKNGHLTAPVSRTRLPLFFPRRSSI